jgi:hypothetical protein
MPEQFGKMRSNRKQTVDNDRHGRHDRRSLIVIRTGRWAAPLIAATLLVGMSGTALAAGTADVRVLHASPDAPAVDVYLDDNKVDALTNVPFGTISDYLAVPAGKHNVKVYATGTTSSPVIDADVTVAGGSAYTIAATGALADITAQVLKDDPSPTAKSAKVRVIHFSADAPAVDIATKGSSVGDAIVKGLTYPNATDYLALPGGTYDLEVRLAGETTVALALDNAKVQNGKAYSVFAIGSAASPALGGNALQAVVAVDATATAATATVPPTDTLPSTSGTASQPSGLWAVALLIAAASTAVASTLFARRAKQD